MLYKEYCRGVLSAPTDLAKRSSGNTQDQEIRNVFMRDRDRILYSKSFRNLAGKTQVYLPGYYDYQRTRLTHTLEVSQIARTISAALGLNCDLTEAIALGHDIGHTPFGHVGERILHEIMSPDPTDDAQISRKTLLCNLQDSDEIRNNNMYGFKHNCQSIRNAIRLESNYGEYGLDLTNYTLWGMFFHSKQEYKTGKVSTIFLKPNFHKIYDEAMTFSNQTPAWSFEAFVVREADEIAQRHHDLEDAIRSGSVSRKEAANLIRLLLPIMSESDRKSFVSIDNRGTNDDEFFISNMSRIVVNSLVTLLVKSTQINMEVIINNYSIHKNNVSDFFLSHSHNDNYFSKTVSYSELNNSETENQNIERFKERLSEKILNSYDVQRSDSKGMYIVRKLFDAYFTNPQQLPNEAIERYLLDVEEYKSKQKLQVVRSQMGIGAIRHKFMKHHEKFRNDITVQSKLMRVICDHIALMTDENAISEYKKLYG